MNFANISKTQKPELMTVCNFAIMFQLSYVTYRNTNLAGYSLLGIGHSNVTKSNVQYRMSG